MIVEQERAMDLEDLSGQLNIIQLVVELHEWQKIIKMKGQHNLSWVTEFLASTHPEDFVDKKGVIVRKKKVKFTPKGINEFYRTGASRMIPTTRIVSLFAIHLWRTSQLTSFRT